MTQRKQPVNPFYMLLVIAGVAFTVTASAFVVMTVRGLRPELIAANEGSGAGLMTFLDQHGFRLMLIELGVLAVSAGAAMTMDAWCSSAQERSASHSPARRAVVGGSAVSTDNSPRSKEGSTP